MDIEFHYYITAILARACGFSHQESIIIATSNQLVDDLVEDVNIDGITIMRTSIKAPCKNYEDVLMAYHFLPGDIVGDWPLRHPLMTTPNSFLARLAMSEALKDGALERIGIALHAFSDSYAHANYIGAYHNINSSRRILDILIPAIGHLDRLALPDSFSTIWYDNRLINKQVNNQRRFIKCAEAIVKFLSYHKGVTPPKTILKSIRKLCGEAIHRDIYIPHIADCEKYMEFYFNCYGEVLPPYNMATITGKYWHLDSFKTAAEAHKSLVMPFIEQRRRA